MNGQFQGKVALVTGAGAGMGEATALAFAREGAKVVVADVDIKRGEETVRMIKEAGSEGIFIKTDVSRRSEVEALVRKTVEQYGQLDCACNNAGIQGGWAPTAEYTEEMWDNVININLKGVWLCMKYEISQMLKQGGGAIVNIASGLAFAAMPNEVGYIGSKHGVVGVTRSAALEYATAGIRINAVCPGITRTKRTAKLLVEKGLESKLIAEIPIRRLAEPEEIAAAVLWLCSDRASYVVGHALVVDGGVLIRA